MKTGAGLPRGQERIRVLYEEYIHYHWLKQVWDSPVTARPQLEPCFAAAMHGVELAFLQLADFINDKRMYIARRPRIEAMTLDIRAQVQLLGELVDGELEEEGQPLCTTLTQEFGADLRGCSAGVIASLLSHLVKDFPFECCPPTCPGPSHSSGLSHVIQAVRAAQNLMTAAERNSLIKVSLQISSAFQGAFQRWTVGLGIEHQINTLLELQGVRHRIPVKSHNLDYAALVRPQVVEATLTKEVYDNPEDYFFRSIHLGTECWMFVANTCVRTAAEFAREGRWHVAAARITQAARILHYLGDHMMTLTRMNLRDYLYLKVQLEGTSGAGSSQMRAARPLVQGLMAPLTAAVREYVKLDQADEDTGCSSDGDVPAAGPHPISSPGCDSDPGCEDIQLLQALKQVYLHCDQYPGLYNYAKALEDAESALQGGFYFKHYCLAANVIGSEARGTMRRAVAALKSTYERQLFPVLDAVRSQLGAEFDQSLSHMKGRMMDDIIDKYSQVLDSASSERVPPQVAMIPPDVLASAAASHYDHDPGACVQQEPGSRMIQVHVTTGPAAATKDVVVLGKAGNADKAPHSDATSQARLMCPFMSMSQDVQDPCCPHVLPGPAAVQTCQGGSSDGSGAVNDSPGNALSAAPAHAHVHGIVKRDTLPCSVTLPGHSQFPTQDDDEGKDGCIGVNSMPRSRSLSLPHMTLALTQQEGDGAGNMMDQQSQGSATGQVFGAPLSKDEEATRRWLYSPHDLSPHFMAWLAEVDKCSSSEQGGPAQPSPAVSFLSHAWGHIPPRAVEAGCRALAECAARGNASWDTFFGSIMPQAAAHVLRLLGCAELLGGVRPNVHWGGNSHELVWRLISGVAKQDRQPTKVLSSDMEFYSFTRQANKACASKLGYMPTTRHNTVMPQGIQWDVVPALPAATFVDRFVSKAGEVLPDVIYCSQITYLTQSTLLPDIPVFIQKLSDAMIDVTGAVTGSSRQAIQKEEEEDINMAASSCSALMDGSCKKTGDRTPIIIIDGYHGFCAVPTDLSAAFILPAVASGQLHIAYVAGLLKHAACGPHAAFMVLSSGCVPQPHNTGWLADVSVLSPGSAGIRPGSDVQYTPGLELQGSTPSYMLPVITFCELMKLWDNTHHHQMDALNSTTAACGVGNHTGDHKSTAIPNIQPGCINVQMIHKHVMYLQQVFLERLKTLTQQQHAVAHNAEEVLSNMVTPRHRTCLLFTYEQLVDGGSMVVSAHNRRSPQRSPIADACQSHTLVFRFDTPQQVAVAVSKLASYGVAVDCRQRYLRIGFGFNHTLEDVELLARACCTS